MALVVLALHIWFVNNARRVIIETVAARSHGKLSLELSQLSFHFLSSQLQVKQAKLVSTDTTSQAVSYNITFDKLSIKVGSFWPLLFNREIAIDSVEVLNPIINITQWRKDSTRISGQEDISIPRQMGKIYNSMLDGLEAFGIQRIHISNAQVRLLNKLKPDEDPVVISNIHFNLVNTSNAAKRDAFIENKQTVDLTTTHQNIALPGGRHRLSFRGFNLNLFNRRMELDSCTVTAIAKDSMKSSYSIFFDKLLLVGVDFNAMYKHNLIKADSVYCENPLFDININTNIARSPKKERPDPNKIIQELTGDLDLAFVGVKQAGIHINITGKKERSLFNSNKDDFEMRGLKIYADSARPVVIDRFDMLVRDYHLYNEDSSAAYTFDSIHFLNNKITLNNFSVTTTSSPDKNRSERDFKIPLFELTGLDWYQLIFEETLEAREAVLYSPVIKYRNMKSSRGKVKKTSIFKSMQLLDNVMTLDRISIVNGQLDMQLGATTSLKIKDANISLNHITEDFAGLREAVSRLSFSNAVIKIKDITTLIYNAAYSGTELIHADRIIVTGRSGFLKADVKDVFINNLLINENSETVMVQGLKWRSANVHFRQPEKKSGKRSATDISLSHIEGYNTRLFYSSGDNEVTSYIQSLKLESLVKNPEGLMQVKGLSVIGNDLHFKGDRLNVKASSYFINSETGSNLTNLEVNRVKERDSIFLIAPALSFTGNMNEMLAGDIHLNEMVITKPVLKVNNWNESVKKEAGLSSNGLRIDRLKVSEPDIQIALHRNDSITRINLPVSENSAIAATGLQVNDAGFQLAALSIQAQTATLEKRTGEIIGVEKGKLDMELSNLKYANNKDLPSWSLMVNSLHLTNPNSFRLSKNNKLQLTQTSVGNIQLSSESVFSFSRLLKENISAWVKGTTGEYIDSNTTLNWYNAAYNSAKKILSLDSFRYTPTQSLDSVMANAAFQKDYITLKTGAVTMSGFNLESFEKDSSLVADVIEINQPLLTVYRDKAPPFLEGNLKPLPVDMIRNITMPVDVGSLKMNDGTLHYTERNAKTRAEGTLDLTRMNARVSNLKNRDLTDTDSLVFSLDAFLMDSSLLNLMVKESYTDSLRGFLMTLRLKPTTVSLLNPVLVPLSNVLITSGTIDSFQLNAIGREDLAIGEMQMYYHDLRIKLIKNGDPSKTNFMGRVANFLVNSFVIRKNNKGRTGLVFYERAKDRSFFNYLVKITFSGMATSIGVKKNRKYMKEYKRELKERNLPGFYFK